MRTSRRKLRAISREERRTARDYRRRGFYSQARDEARHSRFFRKKASS